MNQMAKGRAPDRNGIILEMFLYGGDALIAYLTFFLNSVVSSGRIPPKWRESFFVLLHKGGDSKDPNNWRPIAILSISCKIFSRVIYNRIRKPLDQEQSDEQFGFRSHRSTSDALLIAESVISKSLEYNVELWLVSVDLRKAFDRVEHDMLFKALRSHGLGEAYCKLLRQLYDGQEGVLNEDLRFGIGRGVRQGDVLSPLLFNSVLEAAIREWKQHLQDHGLAVGSDSSTER